MRLLCCAICICICVVEVSTLEVHEPLTFLRQDTLVTEHRAAPGIHSANFDRNDRPGVMQMPSFLSKHLGNATTLYTTYKPDHVASVSFFVICVLVAVFLLGAVSGYHVTQAMTEGAEGTASHETKSTARYEASGAAWTRKHRESEKEEERQALILLLRCGLLSEDLDFAGETHNGKISKDRLEEGIWIAKVMLQKKTLQEWITLSQVGRQSFEEAVTSAIETRKRNQSLEGLATIAEISAEAADAMDNQPVLKRDSSAASIGSAVSFRCNDQDKFPPVVHSAHNLAKLGSVGLPEKSPVPIVNCTHTPVPLVNCFKDELDSSVGSGSTNIEDEPEKFLPSIFSSPAPSQSAPTEVSSSYSSLSLWSPAESTRTPNSPARHSVASTLHASLSAHKVVMSPQPFMMTPQPAKNFDDMPGLTLIATPPNAVAAGLETQSGSRLLHAVPKSLPVLHPLPTSPPLSPIQSAPHLTTYFVPQTGVMHDPDPKLRQNSLSPRSPGILSARVLSPGLAL